MTSLIGQLSYYLPDGVLDCNDLEASHPDWNISKSLLKTGTRYLHHAAADETTVDMAYKASFEMVSNEKPDTIIFCTQTPDNLIPQCSARLQARLGLPPETLCLDINMGCSGYTYGLATAFSYLNSGLSKKILFITADNYSKIMNPENKNVYLLFSDAASATMLHNTDIHPIFQFGTDGTRSETIVCKNSGISGINQSMDTSIIHKPSFEMDGYGVYLFTLGTIPNEIKKLLDKANCKIEDIDLFVLHQASRLVLESIGKKMKIPDDKLVIDLEDVGNTTSSSIPIALSRAESEGRLKRGNKILIFGFGIGLSWSGAILRY